MRSGPEGVVGSDQSLDLRRRRDRTGIALVFCVAAVLAAVALAAGDSWDAFFGASAGSDPRLALRVVFGWKTWAGVGVLLALEHRYPADPTQPLFGPSLARDLTFTVFKFGAVWWLLYAYLDALISLMDRYLPWLHPAVFDGFPRWLAIVLSYVVADGVAWWHHWLRHKGVLWRFHAVHHSATAMNAFTDDRAHPFELFLGGTIVAIPLFVLTGGASVDVLVVSYLLGWFTRFVHCNIATDLGPLRYVLVTPRSHWVHHSMEPEHADRNFGVVLSVWDRLFGTHIDVPGELPRTGVTDRPHSAAERDDNPVRSFSKLLVAPFVR